MNPVKKTNRLSLGHVVINHKGVDIPTSVGSRTYEGIYSGIFKKALQGHIQGSIPAGYEHRPDLISDLFYSSSLNWWKVCEVNNVFDIFEQLNSGDGIYIPS